MPSTAHYKTRSHASPLTVLPAAHPKAIHHDAHLNLPWIDVATHEPLTDTGGQSRKLADISRREVTDCLNSPPSVVAKNVRAC